MDSYDDTRPEPERADDFETALDEHETHATTGGAAAAGAVTGGVIGLAGGPIGAAIGAVGGAIIGAASERLMHSDDDRERARAGYADNDDMVLRDQGEMVSDTSPIGRHSADSVSRTDALIEDTGRPSTTRRDPPNGADQLPGTDPLRNDPLR